MNERTLINVNAARQTCEQLASLGIDAPPDLARALALYDEADAYDHTPPEVDVTTLEPGGVAKLIAAAIDARLRTVALREVKADIITRLAGQVTRAATAASDDILGMLEPVFTPAAKQFTDASRRLPRGWEDPAHLVQSGPDALAALVEAQAALPTLDACRTIRRGLPTKRRTHGLIHDGTMFARCTDPANAEAAARCTNGGVLGYFGELVALDGVELHWWPTAADHDTHASTLTAEQAKPKVAA